MKKTLRNILNTVSVIGLLLASANISGIYRAHALPLCEEVKAVYGTAYFNSEGCVREAATVGAIQISPTEIITNDYFAPAGFSPGGPLVPISVDPFAPNFAGGDVFAVDPLTGAPREGEVWIPPSTSSDGGATPDSGDSSGSGSVARPIIANPTGIVLHWTGGNPNATVNDFVRAIKSNKTCGPQGCSVQVFISGDGTMYQLTNPLNSLTQHAGIANACCIGIEIAGGGAADLNGNTVQFNAVVQAVAYIQSLYGIPTVNDPAGLQGIIGHYQVSSDKSDPGEVYLNRVLSALTNGLNNNGSTLSAPTNLTGPKLYASQQLTARGWDSREFACLDVLWERESNWEVGRVNTTTISSDRWAHGLPQHRNETENLSFIYGEDYQERHPIFYRGEKAYISNADMVTEINWGLDYIAQVYTTPCRALL